VCSKDIRRAGLTFLRVDHLPFDKRTKRIVLGLILTTAPFLKASLYVALPNDGSSVDVEYLKLFFFSFVKKAIM